jgi:hypothetical protein
MRLILGFIGIMAIVGVVSIGSAEAQSYKYTYKSANYTEFDKGGSCLTSAMHMTITLYLPAPIPPNANQYQVQPISWTASNGLHAFNSTSRGAGIQYGVFNTNAKGKITNWMIGLYADPKHPLEYVATFNSGGVENTLYDTGWQYPCQGSIDEEAYSYTPKTWKQPKP